MRILGVSGTHPIENAFLSLQTTYSTSGHEPGVAHAHGRRMLYTGRLAGTFSERTSQAALRRSPCLPVALFLAGRFPPLTSTLRDAPPTRLAYEKK